MWDWLLSVWEKRTLRPTADVCNRVWFIAAFDGNDLSKPVSQGSAVTLRLRQENGNEFTCLLTAAHVVRPYDANVTQLGPRYPLIKAWRPQRGYNQLRGFTVVPHGDLHPLEDASDHGATVEYSQTADWVVLEFEKAHLADITEDVFRECASAEIDDEARILGYPNGDSSFSGEDPAHREIVVPIPTEYGTISNASETFKVEGVDAKKGRSGGATMTRSGSLIGIHRAGLHSTDQSFEISMRHIETRLREKNYGWVSLQRDEQRIKKRRRLAMGTLMSSACMLLLMVPLVLPFLRSSTKPHEFSIITSTLEIPERKAASDLNNKVDSLLRRLSKQELAYVWLALTDSSEDRSSIGTYTIQSSLEGVELDVAAVAVQDGREAYSFDINPPRLSSRPVQLTARNPDNIEPGTIIKLVIGVRASDGRRLDAQEVRESLVLKPADQLGEER